MPGVRASPSTSNSHKRMIKDDPTSLTDTVVLREPLVIRNVAFDTATFDALKDIRRSLEQRIRRDTSNAEVLKYVLLSHLHARVACGKRR